MGQFMIVIRRSVQNDESLGFGNLEEGGRAFDVAYASHKVGGLVRAFFVTLCIALAILLPACKYDAGQKGAGAKRPVAEERETKKLLPAADAVEGWKPTGRPRIFSGEALFEHIDGGADIYFEYGFVTLARQQYDKGDVAVSIEIYCMKDAPAAFGIYSYNRHPDLSLAEVGNEGVIHPNGVYFWQARYYVDIRRSGPSIVSTEDFLALARAVAGKIGTNEAQPAGTPLETALPEIIGLLPVKDMVPRSQVYARGKLGINNQVYVAEEDLFGLGEDDAAAIARYSIGRTECSVIIAQYSTEEACREAFGRFRAHFLGSQSPRVADPKETEFVAAAMPGKYHGARKVGRRLVFVANVGSANSAIDILGRAFAQ